MKTYSEKLKDPRWQKKRLKILERDQFSCRFCGDEDSTLHIHHISYNNNPWDVPDLLLITLCKGCHKKEEEDLSVHYKTLVKELRALGFLSDDMDFLIDMLKNKKGYWTFGDILFDIVGRIIENKKLLDGFFSIFFQQKSKKGNG